MKKEWDSDRAWDFIRQTATEIALIHPGQAALDWAAAERPELLKDIATTRDSIRDAVHDQDNERVKKAVEDWKRAYVRLFEDAAAPNCTRPAPLIDGEPDSLS